MSGSTKARLIFIAAHFVLITWMVVFQAWGLYPMEATGRHWRTVNLKEIYDELLAYHEESGSFPESIEPLLNYDQDNGVTTFGSKELHYPLGPEYPERIHFKLIDGKPVIYDVGEDKEMGGLGLSMDLAYPEEYEDDFSFGSFTETQQFINSFVLGSIMAGAMSWCLYGMWNRKLSGGTRLPIVILLSLLFLVFEAFVAHCIMFGHVYPHH